MSSQLQRLFNMPNHGRRDGESDESWMNRVRYAAMDTDKNNQMKQPEAKAATDPELRTLWPLVPPDELPVRRLPTAGNRVARMPSAGCR